MPSIAVVQVDDLDRQFVLLAGRQLLDTHLDRAFTGDAGHLRARIGEQDAHAVRQTNAHSTQATGVDPATRLVELVVLRSKHLVLADIRGNEGIAAGHFVQLLDHVLRHDVLALAIGQRVRGHAIRRSASTSRPLPGQP